MNKQPFTTLFNEVFAASRMTNRGLADDMNARLGAIPGKDTVRSTFKGRLVQVGPVAVTDRTVSRWKVGVLPARKEWLEALSEVLFPEMNPRQLKRRWSRQLRFAVADRYAVTVDEERVVKKEDVAAIPVRPLSVYLQQLATRFDTATSSTTIRVQPVLWRRRCGEPKSAFPYTIRCAEDEIVARVAVMPEVVFHKEHLWQAAAAEAFLAECPNWVLDVDEVREMVLGLMSSGLVEMYVAMRQK